MFSTVSVTFSTILSLDEATTKRLSDAKKQTAEAIMPKREQVESFIVDAKKVLEAKEVLELCRV